MSSLRLARGTYDLVGNECEKHIHVIQVARKLSELYGFQEIITPIIEFASVYQHAVGETSDIVTKEMFSLVDRKTGGASDMVLRPEGTAGTMRAILMNTAGRAMPQKYFYSGPMFRYERPQKGRNRQFYQVGVETVGAAESLSDVETIALGHALLKKIGIQNTQLQLNTLGDTESRASYHIALVSYLQQYSSDLSDDSKTRLTKNPLRILDSKDTGDQKIVADAPLFNDHLNKESRVFFDEVQQGLQDLNIPYKLNQRLVRGLDYYCHTAFEFTTDDLGAQGTVIAGGRYDELTKIMGGPKIPGVGWAVGIDRLCLIVKNLPQKNRPIAIVPISDKEKAFCFRLTQQLREHGLSVDFSFKGNVKARMKKANASRSSHAVMVGEDEINSSTLTVRELDSGEQHVVALNVINDFFKDKIPNEL